MALRLTLGRLALLKVYPHDLLLVLRRRVQIHRSVRVSTGVALLAGEHTHDSFLHFLH